jgi:inorganic pyrophosphatase
MITPVKNFNKIVRIIKSCETYGHLEVANKCIDLFIAQRDENISYYKKNKNEKPIAVRGGKYDHDMAVWMLIKIFNKKCKYVK